MARLILWPGLAADERMYQRIGACGWQLVTPRLPVPQPAESLADYARRCAKEQQVSELDLVGGCSFGALVAAEVARQQAVRALVLLAGGLDSTTLIGPARWLGRLPALMPLAWLRRFFASDFNLRRFFGAQDAAGYALVREMLAETPDALLRYGGKMAISQPRGALPEAPVYALHGSADRVFRPAVQGVSRIVAGAGHGLVFSHAEVVTDFLRDLRAQLG